MIEFVKEVLAMASYGYYGGTIGDMLNSWYEAGIFSYVLPFLLIFAVVFGILSRMQLFGKEKNNRAIDAIIALVVGLMALQFHFVPQFFQEIFPRLGVALAIFLSLLILVGFFIENDKTTSAVLMGIGAIMLVFILVQTAGSIGWSSGYWWKENWPMIAGVVVIIILVATIVGSANPKHPKDPSKSLLAQALGN